MATIKIKKNTFISPSAVTNIYGWGGEVSSFKYSLFKWISILFLALSFISPNIDRWDRWQMWPQFCTIRKIGKLWKVLLTASPASASPAWKFVKLSALNGKGIRRERKKRREDKKAVFFCYAQELLTFDKGSLFSSSSWLRKSCSWPSILRF